MNADELDVKPYPDGFEAMGQPVPNFRRAVAYRHVQQMAPEWSNDKVMHIVDSVANALERDEPYEARDLAMGHKPGTERTLDNGLDLTGAYRLFAVLLSGQLVRRKTYESVALG